MTTDKNYRALTNTNTVIFTGLILLTMFTWAMGQINISLPVTFTILLVTAVIKIQLIGDFFMHLYSVSGFWRWIITLWVIFTGTLITTAFYL